MNNLSFTQEYFLCALKKDGHIPLLKSLEIRTCLLAGGILELKMDGYISIDDKKKIKVIKDFDNQSKYLMSIYNFLLENKLIQIRQLAEKYLVSEKKMKTLCNDIGNSLIVGNHVKESNIGVLKENKLFIPNIESVTYVVEKLRAEFLEEGNLSDESMALGVLFCKSGLMKQYFSNFEKDKLNKRIHELKVTEASKIINNIVDYIDTMIAIIASA